MVDDQITAQLIRACRSRYEAERNGALAEILVYLRNPTGIGDHSNLIDEITKLVDKAAAADERLRLMLQFFKIESSEPSGKES